MGVSLAGADEEEGEQETAAERWGLTWDPEDGPVWGHIGQEVGNEQEDIWTQLLRGGVTGITTDPDGEDTSMVEVISCQTYKEQTLSPEGRAAIGSY